MARKIEPLDWLATYYMMFGQNHLHVHKLEEGESSMLARCGRWVWRHRDTPAVQAFFEHPYGQRCTNAEVRGWWFLLHLEQTNTLTEE